MVVRDDIDVFWHLSPRLVVVRAPSTEVTIQDLHDTLRDLEDEPRNLAYPHIVSTAGKEALGGSVSVGLTSTLLNARLAFEARKTWASEGEVSTADSTGVYLTDNTATFVTDGVVPGASVVNRTDGSLATVLTVLSETQLYTDGLGGGTDNQFGANDQYSVQNVTQVSVSGGNLVAVTDLGGELDPILPTAGTQVVRTSSSSATLQELQDIQYSSFNGRVSVDLMSPYSGTTYPTGTPRQRVNNLADALTICAERGISRIHLHTNTTLGGSLDFSGKTFEGHTAKVSVTVLANANVGGCAFEDMTLNGVLDGEVTIRRCLLGNLTYVDGIIEHSELGGTITLSGSEDATMIDCWDGFVGSGTPIIDFGGTGSALNVLGYHGGLTLRNKSGPEDVSLNLDTGRIVLEPTITAGSFLLRGIGKLENSSGGSTVVDSSALLYADEVKGLVKQWGVLNFTR